MDALRERFTDLFSIFKTAVSHVVTTRIALLFGAFGLIGVFSMFPETGASGQSTPPQNFTSWVKTETVTAETRLRLNISSPGTAQGSVIASPSRHDPDYYFYWVRDGSLTMDSVLELYRRAGERRADYEQMILDFASFSRKNQLAGSASGLGDPRFHVDGSVDYTPWGRPQNDGPALRALMFVRFAEHLLDENRRREVEPSLYSAKLPADSLIKADLEYIAHHWQDKCVDLWEEIKGHHFFTRAVQLAALQHGAKLAERLGDGNAAKFYRATAALIEDALTEHWSATKSYYLATLDSEAGVDHQKPSELDTAVILAVLAANDSEGILSPLSDRVLATAGALKRAFTAIYPVNRNVSVGPAIGRYAEDYYLGGNPWVLTTAAFAELNYRVAKLLKTRTQYFVTAESQSFFADLVAPAERARLQVGVDIAGNVSLRTHIISRLREAGDAYLKRIQLHANASGSLSEQFHRDNGFMIGAYDLTWSYASFLRAVMSRDE